MSIKQQLLKTYKKANKQRRERMIRKFGYTTEQEFLNALNNEFNAPVKETNSERTDMVIAFDTTGSMKSYIDAVKKQVKELIPELLSKSPDLQIKIVAFGDYCDKTNINTFGDAYQESQLTSNANDLIDFVDSAKNTSGGDYAEFYELVLYKIHTETPWRENSKKAVLLIADAVPHHIGYYYPNKMESHNTLEWKKVASNMAKDGIQVDTIAVTQDEWYKELSKITNGVHSLFSSSEKTVDLVRAATYSRSSTAGFSFLYSAVVDGPDSELSGMVKSYKTKL